MVIFGQFSQIILTGRPAYTSVPFGTSCVFQEVGYNVVYCLESGIIVAELREGTALFVKSSKLRVLGDAAKYMRYNVGAQGGGLDPFFLTVEYKEERMVGNKVILSGHVPQGLDCPCGACRTVAHAYEAVDSGDHLAVDLFQSGFTVYQHAVKILNEKFDGIPEQIVDRTEAAKVAAAPHGKKRIILIFHEALKHKVIELLRDLLLCLRRTARRGCQKLITHAGDGVPGLYSKRKRQTERRIGINHEQPAGIGAMCKRMRHERA